MAHTFVSEILAIRVRTPNKQNDILRRKHVTSKKALLTCAALAVEYYYRCCNSADLQDNLLRHLAFTAEIGSQASGVGLESWV